MLDIDGEYSLAELEGAGGARSGSGGRSSDDGGPGAGGVANVTGGAAGRTGGTGGDVEPESCTDLECDPGKKCCSITTPDGDIVNECVFPSALVGCSLDSCERCPAPPAFANPACVGSRCDFTCIQGFVEEDGECVPDMTGAGGGGDGGSGGMGPQCAPMGCPGCSLAGPVPCCSADDRCGCTWAPGGYCLPTEF